MSKGFWACALALVIFLSGSGLGFAKTLSVQVNKGKLMENPSFFSKLIKTLPYGFHVEIAEEKGLWCRLENPSGWMHSSALTERKIVLRAGQGQAKIAADKEELALAGKGFNKEVEAKFKAQGKGDFASVDKMEKQYNFTGQQLIGFLREGGLNPGENQ